MGTREPWPYLERTGRRLYRTVVDRFGCVDDPVESHETLRIMRQEEYSMSARVGPCGSLAGTSV